VPVTAGLLVLVGTLVALLLGFEEATVGSVAAAPGVPAAPGTTAVPESGVALPPPPPPHPANKADSSNAMNQPHVDAESRLQLLIFVSI